MGQTLKTLARRSLEKISQVFPRRMVVEACEDFHFHYRNLRIRISYADWPAFAKGFSDSYLRWEKQDRPFGQHAELCRKTVATLPCGDDIQVNLNRNLYKPNKGKIFETGSNFTTDQEYIHIKIRDLRLEMSLEEFEVFSSAVIEAQEALCQKSAS